MGVGMATCANKVCPVLWLRYEVSLHVFQAWSLADNTIEGINLSTDELIERWAIMRRGLVGESGSPKTFIGKI